MLSMRDICDPDAVSRVVEAWFEELDEQSDETIVAYISGMLQDPESLEWDDLEDVVSGTSEAFSCMDSSERQCKLLDMVQRVQQLQNASQPASGSTVHNIGRSRASEPVASSETTPAAQDHAAETAGICHTPLHPQQQSEQQQEDSGDLEVQQLHELCGGVVSREYLRHVLLFSLNGDVHSAVEWVLEAEGELPRREAAWRTSLQKEVESAREDQLALERNRRLVLDRFDLQKINRGTVGKKGSGSGQPVTWIPDKDDSKRTVRYREGQAVTSKGEKFIVEKLKEEWDGGSTGKVFTKGKRGKGFV